MLASANIVEICILQQNEMCDICTKVKQIKQKYPIILEQSFWKPFPIVDILTHDFVVW